MRTLILILSGALLTGCGAGGGGASSPQSSPIPIAGPQSVSVDFICSNQFCTYLDEHAGALTRLFVFGTSQGLGVSVPINGTAVMFASFMPDSMDSNIPSITQTNDSLCVSANLYAPPIVSNNTDGSPYLNSNPNIDAGYCWLNNTVTKYNLPGSYPISAPNRTIQGWVNTFNLTSEFTLYSTPTVAGNNSGGTILGSLGGFPSDTVQHLNETCAKFNNVITCSYFKIDLN